MRRSHLPVEQLHLWAKINGVEFHGTKVEHVITADGEDRRSGIVSTTDRRSLGDDHVDVLVLVPRGLVLSQSLIEEYAKSDKWLRELLDAVGEFARIARGAILIFLLLQITSSSPDIEEDVGVANPISDYIKFLPPEIVLPTFYSEAERELLFGTSLIDALDQKIRSLEREFELLRASTINIPWCDKHWWDGETGRLSFDDWKQVDAIFRSRGLDMPGSGHVMVPCIEMANHASGDETKALYEIDRDGNAVLQLRSDKDLKPGEEVTITYGEEKGASEMIFSYGFLESEVPTARQLFLDLDIPPDDPLRRAKKSVCGEAPGVRIYTRDGKLGWESNFIWWACINEEDGLNFRVLQSTDGNRELKVEWKGEEFVPAVLRDILSQDPMWSIFQLRATVMLQERIERQAVELQLTDEEFEAAGQSDEVRHPIWKMIKTLRTLEYELFEESYQSLQDEKTALLDSEVVRNYLGASAPDPPEDAEDDFS